MPVFFNVDAILAATEFSGGSIGGPIVKNKAFFFFDTEQFRDREDITLVVGVPTQQYGKASYQRVCSWVVCVQIRSSRPIRIAWRFCN